MNAQEKLRIISMLLATIGFTLALAEIGMFSRAAFQQSPNLYVIYALLYAGIIGIFLSMIWKK